MARKPIELERAGMRTPRERTWDAIRKLRSGFTRLQVQDATKPLVDHTTVDTYITSLLAAGHIKARSGAKLGVEQRYDLARDAFEAPRVTRSGRSVTQGLAVLAMWRSIQVLKEFDYLEIARAASVGQVQVAPATAKKYINFLARAGYFRPLIVGKGGIPSRFKLIRDTGAHPPAITRRKCVFDRNLGKFTFEESAQEVCDGLD